MRYMDVVKALQAAGMKTTEIMAVVSSLTYAKEQVEKNNDSTFGVRFGSLAIDELKSLTCD